MPSSVSLAIMVRDDAQRIKRCIQSAKAAVDEVLVLDTGSTDDTVAVAQAEGALVTQMEWPGSFSDGLNALLAGVRTDWTLRLDSDEWFETDPREAIRQCIEDEEARLFRLIRRDIQPHGGYEEIALIRLWRSHRDLQYHGIVHENIPLDSFQSAWPGKADKDASLWFWHDGYAGGHLEKIRRNLDLMEQELRKHPGQPFYEAMLVKGLKDVEDPRWQPLAGEMVDHAVQQEDAPHPLLAIVFAEYLGSLEGESLRQPRVDHIARRTLDWFPRTPVVMVALSNMELKRGNKVQAVEALARIADMAESGDYDRTLPVNPALFGTDFWKHLDRLADQAGRWDLCKRCEAHL